MHQYPMPTGGAGDMPVGFDAERFCQLLLLVGDHREVLLDHAISDLGKVRDGLAGPDLTCQEIRRQSHVLSALAGTLGETRLQAMAEDLNRRAHAGQIGDTQTALEHLDALLRFLVASKRHP